MHRPGRSVFQFFLQFGVAVEIVPAERLFDLIR